MREHTGEREGRDRSFVQGMSCTTFERERRIKFACAHKHTHTNLPTHHTPPGTQSMGSLIRRIYDQIKPTVLHEEWRQDEGLLFVRETLRIKSVMGATELVLRLEYGAIHWGRVE